MATAPIYCTHKELKRVYPQIDSFDTKRPLYGWVEVTTNKYAAHNSGLVSQLFADGEDLGSAQSAHTDLNVEGEWFYNSAEDICYYYSASTPLNKLMEAGEEFATLITQFRTDASRYLDSKLDPNLPREQLKDKSGNFDYMIIRSSALIAAAFLIRATDPTNEVATALMEEAQGNIDALNNGNAALSWQTTRDASTGIVRDVTYTDGQIRPVDTRGNWNGTYDLVKVKIIDGGAIGTATYSVWTKDSDQLKNNQVVTAEKINGDYQALAGGLQIRFGGESDSSTATANNEWEIEVMGAAEHIDASGVKSVKNTRWL
tara:strand:- start:8700 stop:9647 length:948 start_codon:yes stop_codon:yes gene_type:complete